jgi:hypothetical protein
MDASDAKETVQVMMSWLRTSQGAFKCNGVGG